ncbi:MAG: DUF5131 family protein [Halobacteriales archaeon]|nr:DUF5131 family protein [Halobacteriales archaeon]
MPVQQTNIVWTDLSANHHVACAKGERGCRNCWAADVADRFGRTSEPWTVANVEENLRVYDEDISALLQRREPGWCFFPSSSDPFLPQLPEAAYAEWREAIEANDHLCFQALTKWGPETERELEPLPPNVMLGVTVETPRRLYRLDWLREQQAAVKFVSFEPLIEPIENPDLTGIGWAIVGGESGVDRRRWEPR